MLNFSVRDTLLQLRTETTTLLTISKKITRGFLFPKAMTCVYIYQKYENLHMLLFPQPSPRQTGKLQTEWVVSAVGKSSGHGPHSEHGDQWFLLRLAVCHKWVR